MFLKKLFIWILNVIHILLAGLNMSLLEEIVIFRLSSLYTAIFSQDLKRSLILQTFSGQICVYVMVPRHKIVREILNFKEITMNNYKMQLVHMF